MKFKVGDRVMCHCGCELVGELVDIINAVECEVLWDEHSHSEYWELDELMLVRAVKKEEEDKEEGYSSTPSWARPTRRQEINEAKRLLGLPTK